MGKKPVMSFRVLRGPRPFVGTGVGFPLKPRTGLKSISPSILCPVWEVPAAALAVALSVPGAVPAPNPAADGDEARPKAPMNCLENLDFSPCKAEAGPACATRDLSEAAQSLLVLFSPTLKCPSLP